MGLGRRSPRVIPLRQSTGISRMCDSTCWQFPNQFLEDQRNRFLPDRVHVKVVKVTRQESTLIFSVLPHSTSGNQQSNSGQSGEQSGAPRDHLFAVTPVRKWSEFRTRAFPLDLPSPRRLGPYASPDQELLAAVEPHLSEHCYLLAASPQALLSW
jgi:hypothetical protein